LTKSAHGERLAVSDSQAGAALFGEDRGNNRYFGRATLNPLL
jgi:hypothetical protein